MTLAWFLGGGLTLAVERQKAFYPNRQWPPFEMKFDVAALSLSK